MPAAAPAGWRCRYYSLGTRTRARRSARPRERRGFRGHRPRPGPVDVLKVAHHGSDDAGLGPLLERTVPSLAVISVGADNPYGHPTAGTLATLARHDVPTLRTDEAGTVTLLVRRRGVSVETGD